MQKFHASFAMAILASVGACSGGGGSAPPAGTGGSAAATPQTNGTSSSASSPSHPSVALDQSSNPAQLTIRVPDIGMGHTFTLAGTDLQNAMFNGAPISNLINTVDGTTNFAIKTDNGGRDVLVYDNSALSYSNYGIWSHSDASGNVVAVGTVAVGTPTPAKDIPMTGLASYSGGVVATGTSGGSNLNLTGAFSAGVDFGARQIGFNSNLYSADASGALHQWGGINGSANIISGTSAFSGTVASWGASDQLNGTMAGSFFGPGAKEIGGGFAAAGGQTTLVGAFGGTLQPPQSGSVGGTSTVGVNFGSGTYSGGALGGAAGAVTPTGTLPTGGLSGPQAQETAGTFSAAGGSTTIVGAFAAKK
jgi:hypothetical protein